MNQSTIVAIVLNVPILAVYATGIGAALYHHKRLKSQATMALVAFLGALLVSVIDVLKSNWYFESIQQGASQVEVAMVLSVVGIFTTVVHAAAMLLLVYAIFWGRE